VAKEIATKLDLKKAYMIAKQNKQMR